MLSTAKLTSEMKPLSTDVLRSLAVCFVLCSLSLLPGAAAQVPGQSREPNTPADTNALQSLALQEAQAGNSDEAIRDYQRVLAVRPEWKEGWWNLGTLQYSSNHFADARSSFLKVVGFAPAMGTAWSLLGLSEFETKDFSDSLAHLEKAQSLGIEDDEIRRVSVYHLGLLLVRNSNFTRARDLLLATFGTGEMSPQLKYVLGLALLRVPLLPDEIDPSKESLVSAAGDIASAGGDVLTRFPGFVTSYPDVPYVHYEYGLALGKAGRDKEALVEMQKETKVSPGSPLPWLEISRLELHGGETGESDAAAAKAKTLESVNRSNREQRILLLYSGVNAEGHSTAEAEGGTELWSRAMQEYAAAMYAPAIADLKPWLMKHPDNGTGWAVLGLSEFALHDFDNALIHLERGETLGLSGSPESLQAAKYTLGILLIRAGEFDRASELLAAALKMTPHDEKIEYALGLSLLRKAGLPQQENQKQAQLVTTAGEIAALLQDSRYDAAFPMFKSLLQQYPSVPFLHYAYGTALLALSQFDEAATQMQAEISISPRSELPYIRLASIRLREDRPADAIPFARQALALSPQSAEAHYLLGRASLENGDDATALHELEVAARLSPDSPEVHFNLAKAYSRAKMPEAAAKERADFVRLNQISENQKSQSGNQMYAGPHDTVNVNHPSQKPD